MKELRSLCDDAMADRAERPQRRSKRMNTWIKSVEKMEKEVKDLVEKGEKELDKKCFGTCCRKVSCATYKIGKVVYQKIDEVQSKYREGDGIVESLPIPPDTSFGTIFECIPGLFNPGVVGEGDVNRNIELHLHDVNRNIDLHLHLQSGRAGGLSDYKDGKVNSNVLVYCLILACCMWPNHVISCCLLVKDLLWFFIRKKIC